MARRRRINLAVFVLGAGTLVGWTLVAALAAQPKPAPDGPAKPQSNAEKQEPEKLELSHFMRAKLDASGKILEGLAVEDYELIKEGAQKLHTMSTAEKWRVSNDALYRQFSSDFQRITKELLDAAQQENLDKAALKWMDATMSCIECHRYARGIMIAKAQPQEGN